MTSPELCSVELNVSQLFRRHMDNSAPPAMNLHTGRRPAIETILLRFIHCFVFQVSDKVPVKQ